MGNWHTVHANIMRTTKMKMSIKKIEHNKWDRKKKMFYGMKRKMVKDGKMEEEALNSISRGLSIIFKF